MLQNHAKVIESNVWLRQVSRMPRTTFDLARSVAWRRRSAQAGNRMGLVADLATCPYGDLRAGAVLRLDIMNYGNKGLAAKQVTSAKGRDVRF